MMATKPSALFPTNAASARMGDSASDLGDLRIRKI
jgi:hypothetical protein